MARWERSSYTNMEQRTLRGTQERPTATRYRCVVCKRGWTLALPLAAQLSTTSWRIRELERFTDKHYHPRLQLVLPWSFTWAKKLP